MNESEILEIEARANAATPGPWSYAASESHCFLGSVNYIQGDGEVCDVCCDILADDAQFIAHAREDIPKLLAEVRRLRELILDAERSATSFGPNGDTASSCPWCFMGHGFAYLTGDGGAAEGHGSQCPAFTPDGKLK